MSKKGTKVSFILVLAAIGAGVLVAGKAKKKKGIFSKLMEDVAVQFPKEKDAIEKKASALLKVYGKQEKGKPKKVTMHTVKRIYPCIAIYQATVEMTGDKEKAYQLIEDFFAKGAKEYAKTIQKLCKIPVVYRLIPTIMKKSIHGMFGEASGFEMIDREMNAGKCHIDMVSCPYHNCCVACGCEELTTAFCNSDDISYGNMHPKLSWERTKTLGRGNDCCNFILRIK